MYIALLEIQVLICRMFYLCLFSLHDYSHFHMSEFMPAFKKKEKVKVVHLHSPARSTHIYLQNALQLNFPDFWLNVLWYCLWLFKCLWILCAILLLKIFANSPHNWKGMVGGFLSGQIFNWLTLILVMSLCHSQASWSLCNKGKDIVSRLLILAVWALMKVL